MWKIELVRADCIHIPLRKVWMGKNGKAIKNTVMLSHTFCLKWMIIYLPVIWFVLYILISSTAESTTCSYVRITTNILLGMDLNLMARRTFFTSTHWFTWHLWKLCNTKCKVHFGNILGESCTTLRSLALVSSQSKKRTYLNLKIWQKNNMWSFTRTDMVMNILQKKGSCEEPQSPTSWNYMKQKESLTLSVYFF